MRHENACAELYRLAIVISAFRLKLILKKKLALGRRSSEKIKVNFTLSGYFELEACSSKLVALLCLYLKGNAEVAACFEVGAAVSCFALHDLAHIAFGARAVFFDFGA
ncbi:hypothetical protein C8N47_10449 [Mangrovibacterium marinum]|uniref:Uncharacterized protein n=1 Tax=Mangrovibacterium marinum TaxID=1639118 RepID=A0A2T5C3X2_9BACT|nr:hypothetical protein C8N47_10449 [Mangrovibacterium marinum]